MARHRTRREMVAIGQDMKNMPSDVVRQPKYRVLLVVLLLAGIAACMVIALYFSLSAPTFGDLESLGLPWHEIKHKWNLQPMAREGVATVTKSVDINRLKNDILPDILIVRKPGTENIIKVKNFLATYLRNLNWFVEEHSFLEAPPASYSKDPIRFTNVIATKDPTATRRLVLACHYDSKVTPEGFLGAVDSAVPCAMLLEIATSLQDYFETSAPDLSLQLIFFDGEEAIVNWTATDSIYGARNLASKWESEPWPKGQNSDKNTLHSIDLFVLLDLLGEKNPKFYSKLGVDHTRHYKELMRIERYLNDGKAYFQNMNISSQVEDDHVPFLKRNVPILHVIPLPYPKQWHTHDDNLNNVNFITVERLTKIFAIFTAEYLHLTV